MAIHFDNRSAALAHLTASGWTEMSNGAWVSRDGLCRATIHPAFDEVVCVFFFELA